MKPSYTKVNPQFKQSKHQIQNNHIQNNPNEIQSNHMIQNHHVKIVKTAKTN